MSVSDEVQKLSELHRSGALTDAEFARAKASVLDGSRAAGDHGRTDPVDDGLGRAANRYVSFQIIAFVIGLIVALILLVRFSGFMDGGDPTPALKAQPVLPAAR